MKIKVQKRNGSMEDYDPNKIIKVSVASGLIQDNAEILTGKINEWVKKRGKPEVTTIQIRDRMIVEMQKINKQAANKFVWYEKLKDKHHEA